jgi:myo-inositol-1(or 4)-monophosphatase
MLTIAVRAARKAGRIITRSAEDLDNVRVARKSANDFVTEVDKASEAAIMETLFTAYPDHLILGEESGLVSKASYEALLAGPPTDSANTGDLDVAAILKAENVWILDPLDGTTNFIHGLPQYCISIALMQRGVVNQAVVYDPNRDELFTATKGRGAFNNDRRIRVTRRDRLAETVIGTGFPFKQLAHLDTYLGYFKTLTIEGASLRRPGAAALDLAYVASGRYDGFFEIGLSPWDVAAGALLVTEAGGLIADLNGSDHPVFSGKVLAGSPKVFSAMVTAIAPNTK